jgi:hypothetical protein
MSESGSKPAEIIGAMRRPNRFAPQAAQSGHFLIAASGGHWAGSISSSAIFGHKRTVRIVGVHETCAAGLAQITIQLDLGRRSLTVPPPSRSPCRSRWEAPVWSWRLTATSHRLAPSSRRARSRRRRRRRLDRHETRLVNHYSRECRVPGYAEL